ncbi:MAG: YbhB/YbcL family Raf kinase inhibitor-like protein [Gemmatimonadaceae bacterium]
MALQITSSAFTHNGAIPREHTCEGRDSAPPLAWSEAPSGTKSFALIVDDPDAPDPKAPKMTYVHWVLYDLPASATGPVKARNGKNDWKREGYGGPCPPIGRHRYFFKLYALDAMLGDLASPTKAQVLDAMEGHVLEHAELMGTYQREQGAG